MRALAGALGHSRPTVFFFLACSIPPCLLVCFPSSPSSSLYVTLHAICHCMSRTVTYLPLAEQQELNERKRALEEKKKQLEERKRALEQLKQEEEKKMVVIEDEQVRLEDMNEMNELRRKKQELEERKVWE